MATVVAGIAGMRWVSYVRVLCDRGEERYVAVGIGHRRPVEVPIGAATAEQLRGLVPFVRRQWAERGEPA